MAVQTVFKRYELKYMLTLGQKEKILDKMSPYMRLDKYGQSNVRNIYLDTDNYRLIRRSIEKPAYKEKLRIRSHSQATVDSAVFVELNKNDTLNECPFLPSRLNRLAIPKLNKASKTGNSPLANIRSLAAYERARRALRGVCEPSDVRRRVRFLVRVTKIEKDTSFEVSYSGDSYGNRTHVTAVKGPCLNRLTNEPGSECRI